MLTLTAAPTLKEELTPWFPRMTNLSIANVKNK